MEIHQHKVKIPKKKKKKKPKNRKRKTWERERVITFLCDKICLQWEREYQIYSKRIGIKIVKIKGRWRDKRRVILMLIVVERWKGKKEGEKLKKM